MSEEKEERNGHRKFAEYVVKMASMQRFGRFPEKIHLEEKMYVDADGDLLEEFVADVTPFPGAKPERLTLVRESPDKIIRNFERERARFIKSHYERMGLTRMKSMQETEEWEETVFAMVPDICAEDFVWLCMALFKFVEYYPDENADNFRVCRLENGETTKDYRWRKASGCCKTHDEVLESPNTGLGYMIGLNFGHSRYKI